MILRVGIGRLILAIVVTITIIVGVWHNLIGRSLLTITIVCLDI